MTLTKASPSSQGTVIALAPIRCEAKRRPDPNLDARRTPPRSLPHAAPFVTQVIAGATLAHRYCGGDTVEPVDATAAIAAYRDAIARIRALNEG